jgi:hypothetical protein
VSPLLSERSPLMDRAAVNKLFKKHGKVSDINMKPQSLVAGTGAIFMPRHRGRY